MSMSYERANLLLQVADRCLKWPNLQPIHDVAMKELQVMADEVVADNKKRLIAEQQKPVPPVVPVKQPTEHPTPAHTDYSTAEAAARAPAPAPLVRTTPTPAAIPATDFERRT